MIIVYRSAAAVSGRVVMATFCAHENCGHLSFGRYRSSSSITYYYYDTEDLVLILTR